MRPACAANVWLEERNDLVSFGRHIFCLTWYLFVSAAGPCLEDHGRMEILQSGRAFECLLSVYEGRRRCICGIGNRNDPPAVCFIITKSLERPYTYDTFKAFNNRG